MNEVKISIPALLGCAAICVAVGVASSFQIAKHPSSQASAQPEASLPSAAPVHTLTEAEYQYLHERVIDLTKYLVPITEIDLSDTSSHFQRLGTEWQVVDVKVTSDDIGCKVIGSVMNLMYVNKFQAKMMASVDNKFGITSGSASQELTICEPGRYTEFYIPIKTTDKLSDISKLTLAIDESAMRTSPIKGNI